MPATPQIALPPAVPAGLQPARAFDSACSMVVDYLMAAAPLGMWAVTRVTQGRQIMLEVRGDEFGVGSGAGKFPRGVEGPGQVELAVDQYRGDTAQTMRAAQQGTSGS